MIGSHGNNPISLQVEDVKIIIPMPSCVINVNPTSTCEHIVAHAIVLYVSVNMISHLYRWHAEL